MDRKNKYPPYPTEDHQAMIAVLEILPHEEVLWEADINLSEYLLEFSCHNHYTE